jgi:phage repressor protein C with HTH and peptisase S24 domain
MTLEHSSETGFPLAESSKYDPFKLRLDRVLQKLSVVEMAQAIGVSDNAIYKWKSGRGVPSVANLVSLAKMAGVSVEWLATGREVDPTRRIGKRSDYTYVPRYDVRWIAPRGVSIRSEQIVDYLAFKTEWVESRLKADPTNLLLIEAADDSMVPTVREGDLVLIDSGERQFRHDGIYVLCRETDLTIKRIQRRADGALSMRSDNASYESSVVTSEDIEIIGRAIWTTSSL